jgi:hypothetical protein
MATTKKLFDTGPMQTAVADTLDRDEQVPRCDELSDRADLLRGHRRRLIPVEAI